MSDALVSEFIDIVTIQGAICYRIEQRAKSKDFILVQG
jgi:hypothetical protein